MERRAAGLAQARALRRATDQNSRCVVNDFLEFFHETGVDPFRDEEEWVFGSLRPIPKAVLRALEVTRELLPAEAFIG